MRNFEQYEYDFGRDNRQEPEKIYMPSTIDEIKNLLNSSNTKIAIRGNAHSTGGQTLSKNGIVCDMKKLSKIGPITNMSGRKILEVEAGATWKEVFKYCLNENLTPPTYADWLDLTVGGTLSTGGVGQCSFKKGLQIDNVSALELATPIGKTLICNNVENKDLFELALGGLGQFGIISRAWIHLENSPQKVFVYKFIFTSLSDFFCTIKILADQDQKIDALQSHIILAEKDILDRYLKLSNQSTIFESLPKQPQYFMLEVSKYVTEEYTLDSFKSLLTSLTKHDPKLIFAQENIFSDHVNRIPPLLTNPLERDFPKHHHCCFFIPASKVNSLLAETFSKPEHCAAMGQGNILIIPLKKNKIKNSFFILPNEENVFFVGILRRHLPPCNFETLVRLNEETYQRVIQSNGKIYPVGSGSFLTDTNYWKWHYGDKINEFIRVKTNYDPECLLNPNIRIIGNEHQISSRNYFQR